MSILLSFLLLDTLIGYRLKKKLVCFPTIDCIRYSAHLVSEACTKTIWEIKVILSGANGHEMKSLEGEVAILLCCFTLKHFNSKDTINSLKGKQI